MCVENTNGSPLALPWRRKWEMRSKRRKKCGGM